MALAKAGDTVLGMSLADGGHLTHGASVSFSGRIYNSVQYGLNGDTGEIDYDQIAQLAEEHQPRILMGGFSAYSRVVDWQRFREIADSVGAYLVVDMAHISGLVAAGVYPSPVQIADVTTSTTHKTLRGPRGVLFLPSQTPSLRRNSTFPYFRKVRGAADACNCGKGYLFQEAMSLSSGPIRSRSSKTLRSWLRGSSTGYDIVSGVPTIICFC